MLKKPLTQPLCPINSFSFQSFSNGFRLRKTEVLYLATEKVPPQNLLQLVRKPARVCSGTRTVFLLLSYTMALPLACWPRSGLAIGIVTTVAYGTEQQPSAQEDSGISHHRPDVPAPPCAKYQSGGGKKEGKIPTPCSPQLVMIHFTGALYPRSREYWGLTF